jgi:hypothetical protein
MATLEVTNEQLKLIQQVLDMYSRIGIGQLWVIKDHPTYYNALRDKLRPKKEIEVGDKTERGEIVEIGDGYIKTKGSWGDGEEIRTHTDVENVKLSIDYGEYHRIRDDADKILHNAANMLLQENFSNGGSFGIYNPDVDESARVAYDIVQVIRHEFWKQDETHSNMTVDSSVHLGTKDCNKIKCKLDKYVKV